MCVRERQTETDRERERERVSEQSQAESEECVCAHCLAEKKVYILLSRFCYPILF